MTLFKDVVPYVATYATLSDLYYDGHSGFLIIVSFSTVADGPGRHHTKVKVSRRLLHKV